LCKKEGKADTEKKNVGGKKPPSKSVWEDVKYFFL